MRECSTLSKHDIHQAVSLQSQKLPLLRNSKAKMSAKNRDSEEAVGTYRSPTDVASPVTQKIATMKMRRINKNNLKQRSLFASTVSNQHALRSSVHGSSGGGGAGYASEGSMADDELETASDKSDDTVVLRKVDETARDKGRGKTRPESVEKSIDDGYLADESERN